MLTSRPRLLFFAFAGYARIATLGEEVRDPQRTLRRAIPLALGIALAVYLMVTLAELAGGWPRHSGGGPRGRPTWGCRCACCSP